MFSVLKEWPHVSRSKWDIDGLRPSPYLSLDFEWRIRDNHPTILGLSDGKRTVSVPYDEGKGPFLDLLRRYPDCRVLGHNLVSADIPVAAREGIHIPLERVEDTILYHWLTNMSLCKGTKKSDDEEGEKRGRGYMNLFAYCSFYTAVPNWKECVGEEQCLGEGRPCPKHDAFGYNGNDCYWPVVAFPSMLQRARMMGVDKLYPLHRDLVAVMTRMSSKGVYVDIPYLERLREKFGEDSDNIAKSLPFNPDSPKQVISHFRNKGIVLANAQQATIEEACEEYDDEELETLCEYGQLGNGPDRWFSPRGFDYDKNKWKGYVDSDGYIHPNLQPFTSTGRLACSNPNLQNISHRPRKFEKGKTETLASRIRRVLIPPPGHWLVEADYSNAENRVMLHLGGHSVPDGVDLHTWVAEIAGFRPEDPFSIKEGSPRQAAKTVQHGNFYGEGISLVTRNELRSPRIISEIAKGLRVAYPEWTFEGKVVTFTGINFARRAFGDASYDNRIKANTIIGKLFGRFPGVRKLQQRVSKQVETERCVRNALGYVVGSYGYDAERIKIALAFTGSNPVAHATKLAMINADGHPHLDCRLQIHDSLFFYVDRRHEPQDIKKWVREVMEVDLLIGGPLRVGTKPLRIPVDVKIGENWRDMEKVR